MKLTDLNPQFLDAGGEGITDKDGNPSPLRKGVGVEFECPCGCDRPLYVGFENPIDGGPALSGEQPRWKREGALFESLTLKPSIKRSREHGGCGWHGFVTNGEVTGQVE